MNEQKIVRKRIAVDFDDTLFVSKYPEVGDVKQGAKEALQLFRELGYTICIWSARASHYDYDIYTNVDPSLKVPERPTFRTMVECLDSHKIPYDEIDDGSKGKPGADFYIDDKAIRFEDNWSKIALFVHLKTIAADAARREREANASN